ncbi:hypothetical protein [Nocardioides plantarum]|uniref:DUF3558 domain-containing protein n=1 Tax=Nocardioides plantarum TaxID=29299 RepID=A0ABV5KBY0_9ACTN|nr:hypothetical protein [Nocardioides plantarum]
MRSAFVGLAVLGLVLTGCSGDPEPPSPDPTSAAPVEPAWNPCSSLDADAVIKRLGAAYSVRRGTPDEPTCIFVPQADGDPAVTVNYQTIASSLTELLKTFGQTEQPGRTSVTTPRVPGASDARLIVDVSNDTLAITGFVRNGLLVQTVDAIDPAPFDRTALTKDVTSLMADLAAGAADSGLTR